MTFTNRVVHSRCFHWAQLFLVTFLLLWRWLLGSHRRCFFHTARRICDHHCDCFSFVTVIKPDRTVEIGRFRSFPKRPFSETFKNAWKVLFTMSSVEFKTPCFPWRHDYFACEHAFLRKYHVHTIHFFRKHCEHVIKYCHMHELSSCCGFNLEFFFWFRIFRM